MTSCALEASAAAAISFREPDALRVSHYLFACDRILVPNLFELEVASVTRTKVLRGEIGWSAARAAVEIMDSPLLTLDRTLQAQAGKWSLLRTKR